jgi:hypothetical protein
MPLEQGKPRKPLIGCVKSLKMSRKNRKSDRPVVVHPPIVDLSVTQHRTSSKSEKFSESDL